MDSDFQSRQISKKEINYRKLTVWDGGSMVTLRYTPITEESALKDFDCGNASVNRLVADSYYPHLLKQSRTYQIKVRDQTVGFYRLSVQGVSLEHSDAPVAERYLATPSYGAVCLDYIAVDASFHHLGIGTAALESIVQQAHALAQSWPVRLLVLDALRKKVPWYSNKDFCALNSSDLAGASETVRMYLDLQSEEDSAVLDAYCDSYYT